MGPKIKLNKSTFVRWKIHIDRSRMYLGYIQFFMMGIVFFKAFEDEPIGKLIFRYAFISIPVLFLSFIFFSILLGYWESRLGLKEEEQKKLTSHNPLMMELIKDIKEIKSELSKKEN
ncbi:MAG: hypothetical protein U0W24_25195 [Bacteroidales bacterium]